LICVAFLLIHIVIRIMYEKYVYTKNNKK